LIGDRSSVETTLLIEALKASLDRVRVV